MGRLDFENGPCIIRTVHVTGANNGSQIYQLAAGLAVLAKRDSARHADVEDAVQSDRPVKRQPALGASDG